MEKTFEELIEAEFARTGRRMMGTENIIEMMQKVREATIAECAYVYWDNWGKDPGYYEFFKLPTDRIITKEKEE